MIGPYGYVFNDFGPKFECLDETGEQPVECFLKMITNSKSEPLITLIDGAKHPYQDGEIITLQDIEGMKNQDGQSING